MPVYRVFVALKERLLLRGQWRGRRVEIKRRAAQTDGIGVGKHRRTTARPHNDRSEQQRTHEALLIYPTEPITHEGEEIVEGAMGMFRLKRDGFSSNRHPALGYCWSMMFSENRCPLFGIML